MRTLYFDCFSGISGDMVLGALIDCGVGSEELKKELDKLNIDGYSIEIKNTMKNGISGTDVNVIIEEQCTHRNFKDIENIINNSDLNKNVKELSILIFKKIAIAESKIHGKTIEEVHYHEVGAIDSIVDIVGAAICFDILKVDRFVASSVNTGTGFVKCQHGIIPVPAPATLEILKGVPIYSLDINTELVTPTGAAILASVCTEYGPLPKLTIEKTGYGCGKKELEIPNILRVIIGEEKKKNKYI